MDVVCAQLQTLETQNNIQIIYACEAGSRMYPS